MSNGIKVLDLFSGAGGFSLGFKLAGYEIIGAVEKDKWAAETYQKNFPAAKVLVGDIQQMTNEMLSKAFLKPEVIIGGPPCQGFSICVKDAGDPKDPRNSLFREYLRVVTLFSPKAVVMENVPNILNATTANGESVVEIIINELKKIGYTAHYQILSASDYGVPQRRHRLIIVGTKGNFENPFPFPTHYVRKVGDTKYPQYMSGIKSCPNLWDAISDLPDIEAREGAEIMKYTKQPENDYQEYCRKNSKELHNHLAMKHTPRIVARFSVMKWGESITDIQDDNLKTRKRNGNGVLSDKPYDQNNRRMRADDICNTITASFYGNFVHPYKNRNFTAREGARIQSFPDTFIFYGKPTVVSSKLLAKEGRDSELFLCQYAQIGNAVPPLMSKAIANNLLRFLEGK
jgi:DNA (cytosine-5)-methyltransferase 1